MLSQSNIERISGKLRIIQIVSGAIISGALFFSLVIFAITDWKLISGDVKMLTLVGAISGFMMIGLSMIVPRLSTSSPTQIASQLLSSNNSDEISDEKVVDSLLENQMTNRIIYSAIIEGAIFLNLITFMLELGTASLVIVGIGFALLVFAFPFTPRLVSWLENNLKEVKDEMKLIRQIR